MKGYTSTISADVMIRAPFGHRGLQPEVIRPHELAPFLQGVMVSNGVDEPYGHFSIKLAPTPLRFDDGSTRTIARLIQPYSLVSIAFHRQGTDDDPRATALPKPLLVGVVDEVEEGGDYQSGTPNRDVSLRGRSLAALLTDHKWWFHHFLAYSGKVELPPDIRDFYAVRPDDRLLRDQQGVRTLGFLAVDPKVFDPSERSPVRLMETAWRFFLEGTRERAPFIKTKWTVPLQGLLRFDAEAAQRSYFDPQARLVGQYLDTGMPDASCWDLMRYFSDAAFTELFSETRGDFLEDAYVEVKCRKPPFAGYIEYPHGQPRIKFSGSGRRPGAAETLFDRTYGGEGGWDVEADTVLITDEDVRMTRFERGVNERTYNLYNVQPAVFPNAGSRTGDRFWQQEIPPIIDEMIDSPSYIERVGLRPLQVTARTIAMLDAATNEKPVANFRDTCLVYAALLREWHFRQPQFWRGLMYLTGRTALRAGKRLLYRLSDEQVWEFYIRKVTHNMMLEEQPSYTTTVEVERGWRLA